jgi:hypothetical protein
MLHIGSGGSVNTRDIANRAPHAMPMPLRSTIAIPNGRDSHVLACVHVTNFSAIKTFGFLT